MRKSRILGCLAAAAVAGITLFAAPAHAAAPSPAPASAAPPGYTLVTSTSQYKVYIGKNPALRSLSDSGCVGDLEWDNIQTCIFINGQSNYVSTMRAVSYVYNYLVLEYVQLSGPSVNYSTPEYPIAPLENLYVIWTVNGNVQPGSYCATSWEAVGSGYTNEGRDCQPVTK
jgi:hypothetical protein